MTDADLGPAGLYIHVPFCRRRCDYCAFVSSLHDAERVARYLDALSLEFAWRAAGRVFDTVFIGGGTPTALDPEPFRRLLALAAPVAADSAEFSLEANPGGFTGDHAALARDHGVNRISFGAQTFRAEGLAALGRDQQPGDPARAVALARHAGFENIGLDLIAGWPGQTLDAWRADLDAALSLAPVHMSCYGLSVEPGTPLADRMPDDPDDAFARACWDEAGDRLARAGLPRYEISNHARPGRACRHHGNYWTGGEYIGLGAGAHSHVAGRRFANTPDVDDYIERWRTVPPAPPSGDAPGPAETFSERLSPEAKARETLVTWLRWAEGVDVRAFRRRTGYDVASLLTGDAVRWLEQGGLVWSPDHARLRLSDDAYPVADAVLCDLVTGDDDT